MALGQNGSGGEGAAEGQSENEGQGGNGGGSGTINCAGGLSDETSVLGDAIILASLAFALGIGGTLQRRWVRLGARPAGICTAQAIGLVEMVR